MAPFYKLVCEQLGWPVDAAKLAAMEKVNAAELESLGEKEKALEAYDETVTKTVALGPKLDIMLSQLRI